MSFGWGRIARLGLVQASLGAIVVLTTSTLNRLMVVEMALPALVPGMLVAWHYLVQVVRPRMGYGADRGGRSTPWILGGMAVLATGGVLASVATAWMATQPYAGIALAFVAFALIGIGVSASGTALLVLLAKRVDAPRRAGSATLVWLMMIASFAITAGLAGHFLDPYSPQRLVWVTCIVAAVAMVVTLVALRGLEGPAQEAASAHAGIAQAQGKPAFRQALREVWAEPQARRFTIFVFIAMLAYSAQDLILEPFAGSVLGYTPGQSTQLSGLQHGGALTGMLLAALAGRRMGGRSLGSLRIWTITGCIASGLALLGLVAAGLVGSAWPFKTTVFVLGVANGAFSIAAIGSMMRLAGDGGPSREGVRMGIWGAAQAVAFGLGGLFGTAASDLSRALIGSTGAAYALVFALEAGLFVLAARLAATAIDAPAAQPSAPVYLSNQPAVSPW